MQTRRSASPKGGIGYPVGNSHFGQDFRDLYLSAHLPIVTDGGVDFKIGRMNTIIGYNGFLSPYRPFYSSDYQFFYSQDGAFTGFLTDLHVNDRLDIWNGMTLGANTFFTLRTRDSFCYIGQINYWLQEAKRTRLTASVYCGPHALFAAPGLSGTYDAMVELRVQQDWSPRFTQVLQSNMGWDANTPVGTGSWYGVYLISIAHLTTQVDVLCRAEWFDDVKGTRTGIDTNYSEVTLGLNWHPFRCLEFRPEIRGDFAGAPGFRHKRCSRRTQPVDRRNQRADQVLTRSSRRGFEQRSGLDQIRRRQSFSVPSGNGGQQLMGFAAMALSEPEAARGSSSRAAPIPCSSDAGRSRWQGGSTHRQRLPARGLRPAATRHSSGAARPRGRARRFFPRWPGRDSGIRCAFVEPAGLRVRIAKSAELDREGQLGTGAPKGVDAVYKQRQCFVTPALQ